MGNHKSSSYVSWVLTTDLNTSFQNITRDHKFKRLLTVHVFLFKDFINFDAAVKLFCTPKISLVSKVMLSLSPYSYHTFNQICVALDRQVLPQHYMLPKQTKWQKHGFSKLVLLRVLFLCLIKMLRRMESFQVLSATIFQVSSKPSSLVPS